MPDGMVDRHEVIAKMNEALARPVAVDRKRWGRDPQAQAGQRAMMATAGGSAPMRPPDAKRPEAWKGREEPNRDDEG